MAPIQMRNLTTFPIERLCFDLKLEVLEQLDAKDVIELVKVNQGFQGMISSRPSIVFGHHVHTIEFGFQAINIKKLKGESRLDVIRHFPFIKNIRSCDLLWLCHGYDSPIDKNHTAFLKQLQAVNSLDLDDCSPQYLELLSHLSIKIKRYARLPSFREEAPSIRDLLGHFIEAQLNECQIVRFDCKDDDSFHFYYNALISTHIKYVAIGCYNVNTIIPAIQRIVSHGIPSENLAAVVRLVVNYCDFLIGDYWKTTIVVFLKGYPGMKQIKGKKRQPFVGLANDRLKGSGYPTLFQALCFRRNINATRDCIYMLFSRVIDAVSYINFFAFYIKPDEIIDH